MLFVLGTVADNVKGGRAGRVLRELVCPELVVGSALVDPVLIHCTRISRSTECTRTVSTD